MILREHVKMVFLGILREQSDKIGLIFEVINLGPLNTILCVIGDTSRDGLALCGRQWKASLNSSKQKRRFDEVVSVPRA